MSRSSIYVDRETGDRLRELAEREARNVVDVLRRMINQYLGALPPFDLAVLHQVAKDEGLDSLLDATSYVIRDWQRLKAARELHRPTFPADGPPHAPAIRVPASEAQPKEA